MLGELPPTFADRAAFVANVMERGHTRGLAQWLAMNLEPLAGAYAFRLDLVAIRAMLTDYYATDLWPAIESGAGDLHVIAAGKSSALDQDDRDQLEMLQTRQLITLHDFAEAGHWVHVEALDKMVTTVAETLPG
jgi:pimeloyl-ACP methyl ester carboxylesterase